MLDKDYTTEYYKMLEKHLDEQGYYSKIPVRQILPRNYSDALFEIEFWKRQGVIVKK